MADLNDRIDLIPIGTWAKGLRPNGLVLTFADYPSGDLFQMQTIQLVDVNGKAIFSVHNIDSDEVIAFNKPTVAIKRLVMYRDGIGIDAPTFACSSIVFKTNVLMSDIWKFNIGITTKNVVTVINEAVRPPITTTVGGAVGLTPDTDANGNLLPATLTTVVETVPGTVVTTTWTFIPPLHPSDVNPILYENGVVADPNLIIPVV